MKVRSGDTTKNLPFVALDATDLKTRETGLASFTVYRQRNGGTATAMTSPTVAEASAANMPGVYNLLMDEDMTLDAGDDYQEMVFHITHAGMAPVSRSVLIERRAVTAGRAVEVDASGHVTPADGSITAGKIASDAITAAKIATGAITAAKFGAGAITATVAPNLDVAVSTRAPSIGALSNLTWTGARAAALDNLDALVSSRATPADVNSEVDTALADYDGPTNAEMEARTLAAANYATAANQTIIAAYIDTEVASIKAVTDKLDDTLEDDGGTYRFTTNALEQSPAGSAPSAASIADAIWDELLAGHATAGSAGQAMSAAGGAADPLLNEVPGDYESGTAGHALGQILTTTEVEVTSPVVSESQISIVRGDDYLAADSRALDFDQSNVPDLTNGTVVFKAWTSTGATLEKECEIVTATGATKRARLELTSEETTPLALGKVWKFEVEATLESGSVITMRRGTMEVLEDGPEDEE